MLTPADVRRDAQACLAASCDDAEFHRQEDALHRRVLRAIADEACGDCSASEMAEEALRTCELAVKRRYG